MAILDLSGINGPELDEGGPLFSHLALETSGCTALPEAARFTLNGVAPDWQQHGGRGRDPFAAFSPDCMWPQASWTVQEAAATAPFVFRLEHEGTSLEAELDEEGAITRCDFPSCTRPTGPRNL